jgi:hypothetical protein
MAIALHAGCSSREMAPRRPCRSAGARRAPAFKYTHVAGTGATGAGPFIAGSVITAYR